MSAEPSETTEVSISEVSYVESLYPRDAVDDDAVTRYRQAIDDLPPITVASDGTLIDGYHRLKAHRVEGRDNIRAEVVDTDDETEILIAAIRANTTHGKQLRNEEKKHWARELYRRANGDMTQADISDIVGVSSGSVSNWLRDIKEEEREDRRQKSWELYLDYVNYPGQRDVADELDVAQKTVANDLSKKLKSEDFTQTLESIEKDNIKWDNVWRFQKCDPQYGTEGYSGRIPGQILENLLYHFTETKDLVVDPMAGGGTTVDVCKAMGRRYAGFDINPLEDKGIVKQNALEGLPLGDSVAQLSFFDPPYWRLVDDGYVGDSISAGSLDEWLADMGEVLEELGRVTKSGGHISLLMEPIDDRAETGQFHDLTVECMDLASDWDWEQRQRISVPMNHGQKSNRDVDHAKNHGYLLDLNRDLVVWEVV